MRKQGVEQNPNHNNGQRKKWEIEKSNSQKINQTIKNPWVKISNDGTKGTRESLLNSLSSPSKERLNQLQLIASGGLSSSFYDQLLYYTRQKNGVNLFGEQEKSRTSNSRFNGDTQETNNKSVPLHSLTKFYCDPTKTNCAKSRASTNNPLNNVFNLSYAINKIFVLMYVIFVHYFLYFF